MRYLAMDADTVNKYWVEIYQRSFRNCKLCYAHTMRKLQMANREAATRSNGLCRRVVTKIIVAFEHVRMCTACFCFAFRFFIYYT